MQKQGNEQPMQREDDPTKLAAPAWITPELIDLTIRVWQPYYATRLTPADAIIMIQDVGRLFGVLSGG